MTLGPADCPGQRLRATSLKTKSIGCHYINLKGSELPSSRAGSTRTAQAQGGPALLPAVPPPSLKASLVRAAQYLTRCDPPAGSRVADHGDGGGAVGAGGNGAGAVRGAFATGASGEPAGGGLETCSRDPRCFLLPRSTADGALAVPASWSPAGSRESNSWEGCRGHTKSSEPQLELMARRG